jgi:DNA-binding SARP family transcriptional activator
VPDLKLFLLGTPRIEHAGAQINVDTRKAVALLAYLAITRQRHSRDALAVLLWPEYDQSSARGALRRTLSTLKKALGGVGLDIERETVGLDSDTAVWLDVEQFQRLLAAGRTNESVAAGAPLTAAVALYGDDFMAGFGLRDSPDFDDWQFFQAESLRRDLATALERLIDCHTRLGTFEPAIAYARRWLALDPLHEPAHRQLMLLYAWAGQRSAALYQYRECVRVLDQELGVPPLDETTQLYQAIKENQTLPAPVEDSPGAHLIAERPADARPVQSTIDNPPYLLVGRTAEWRALLEAYTAAAAGRLVVIEGEAGIGKTRLAEELLTYARSSGATTITARCYEGEAHLAYGPFIDALRAALGQPNRDRWLDTLPTQWLSETARLLPELERLRPDLPPAAPLGLPGAQFRLFEAISQLLLAACRSAEPGLLLVDDLHWADAASLDLLAYMTHRLHGQPICLLLTWRAENMPASQRGRALLAEAQRAGMGTAVSLGRLSRSEVLTLVRSSDVGAAAQSDNLGERLYDETEGLPFFVVEYLAVLARDANLPRQAWPLPGGVRDLLHARLAAVSQASEQVLSTAAVIGCSFDYDTVREVSGRSEEETIDALEQLIAHGLIQELRASVTANPHQPGYDFFHAKLRALVYDEISLARRRLLHRRVAEALTSRAYGAAERDALAGLIAYHYRMAGQDAAAAEQFALAVEHARRIYANTDALVPQPSMRRLATCTRCWANIVPR